VDSASFHVAELNEKHRVAMEIMAAQHKESVSALKSEMEHQALLHRNALEKSQSVAAAYAEEIAERDAAHQRIVESERASSSMELAIC
jgi:flagellar hook-basal body complex protein FliE